MKEEWKVYIKGVPNRGDEVIKALTNLGANNSIGYIGDNPQYLYYINYNGIVRYTFSDSEYGQIIIDNYHKLHLSEQRNDRDWKDGDILIRKDNNNLFCVYQKPVDNGKGFLCHVYVSKDALFTGVTVPTEPADNYRRVTDAEKTTFYSLIHNHHLCWDAENKKLVDWKWKPKIKETYWFILSDGTVDSYAWLNVEIDNSRFSIGNCFKTKKEAKAMAEKIKKLLNAEL